MKDKIWEVEFEGRLIRVTNRFSILPPRTAEILEVDGQVVARGKGGFLSEYSIIEARIDFAGVERQIEVQIAPLRGKSWAVGCYILIDGRLVGGDTTATLLIPDLQHARAAYQADPRRFLRQLVLRRFLNEILPLAIAVLIIYWPTTIMQGMVYLLINILIIGLLSGWHAWHSFRQNFIKTN
ncbi:MAG: hypothetical protein ACKOB4_00145 [Acidobacteriota bacterium]